MMKDDISPMNLVLLFLVITVAILGYLRTLEYRLLFVPERLLTATPADIGLPYEDVWIPTQGELKIHGWLVGPIEGRDVVFFCHGNAGNISHRMEKIRFFHELGLAVFIFDYRGFGLSPGRPTEAGLYKDALSAYDFLVQQKGISPERIVGYGASLGGAVVIETALQRDFLKLIIDSAFTNTYEMAKVVVPNVPGFLVRSRFDNLIKIGDIDEPKLFIHSSNDELVPFKMGRRLYDQAGEVKLFLTTQGLHNQGFVETDEFKHMMSEFLTSHKEG